MISTGILIKKILAATQYHFRILQSKLHAVPPGHGIILTYHRILPKDKITRLIEPGMYVTADTFENHIAFLKDNFEIVSLRDLYSGLKGEERNTNDKPFCSITFDDGWVDFFVYAFPILKKHKTPSTIFLPTSFIGSEKIFWTDRLAHLLSSMHSGNSSINFKNPLFNKMAELQGSFVQKLEQSVQLLKNYDYLEIEHILRELSTILGIQEINLPRSFLNWDEVRGMAKTQLVSFGSHTVNHAILTKLKDTDIVYELEASKDKLVAEGAVDPEFIAFCYPNGNYNRKIGELVMRAGYKLSVTTDCGWVSKNMNLFTLKRIGLHQDVSSSSSLLLYRLLKLL